ncbi:MAG TPA: uroporphyrinogen-III C-methyltransferase [Rubrivivax sp.]|nr:uroporphyrinogen-III C-methyltransferase [Rubrivivax sp.]HPO20532.1 uroporphyrinogen-III C-methyltransferase [Rubrivivax sp.]
MSLLDAALHASMDLSQASRPGQVMLVGAGPGDPELLTVKAARLIGSASIVMHDALVGRGVLELIPRGAHCIDVGKRSGAHKMSQAGIIELLIRLARAGHDVLRLKGGDPYVFGRGGEEAQALAAAGVPFSVVPGISAAQGAAASAGIPLTHRAHAAQWLCVTGHLRDGAEGTHTLDLDWAQLARPNQTLVVYMGVAALALICERLIAHGQAPHTPAALVENATRPEQRCVAGTLATLRTLAREHAVKAPALLVIGTVVALQPLLARAMALAAH